MSSIFWYILWIVDRYHEYLIVSQRKISRISKNQILLKILVFCLTSKQLESQDICVMVYLKIWQLLKNIRMNKIFLIFAGQPEANIFLTRPQLILIKYFYWEAVTPIKYWKKNWILELRKGCQIFKGRPS